MIDFLFSFRKTSIFNDTEAYTATLVSLGLTTRTPTELNAVLSYVSTILSYALTVLVVLLTQKRKECPICCEDVISIKVISSGCAERCQACISCCKCYLSTDEVESISRMRRARSFNIRCFGGCGGRLRQVVAYAYGTEAHRCCINALEAQTRLIENVPANSSLV